jgi:hypothetical protein
MGIFYTNTTLRPADQRTALAFMRRHGRRGFVSRNVEAYVVLFDRETEDQDMDVITELTCRVSRELKCAALTFLVHDTDICLYCLCREGALLDRFFSQPSYFSQSPQVEPPLGGDAALLCQAFNAPDVLRDVEHLFHRNRRGVLHDDWQEGYLNGQDLHHELVKLLGLPAMTLDTRYYALEDGANPPGYSASDFVKT